MLPSPTSIVTRMCIHTWRERSFQRHITPFWSTTSVEAPRRAISALLYRRCNFSIFMYGSLFRPRSRVLVTTASPRDLWKIGKSVLLSPALQLVRSLFTSIERLGKFHVAVVVRFGLSDYCHRCFFILLSLSLSLASRKNNLRFIAITREKKTRA